jgi:hypothetical protein
VALAVYMTSDPAVARAADITSAKTTAAFGGSQARGTIRILPVDDSDDDDAQQQANEGALQQSEELDQMAQETETNGGARQRDAGTGGRGGRTRSRARIVRHRATGQQPVAATGFTWRDWVLLGVGDNRSRGFRRQVSGAQDITSADDD